MSLPVKGVFKGYSMFCAIYISGWYTYSGICETAISWPCSSCNRKLIILYFISDIHQLLGAKQCNCPDSKVHGANMRPIWGRQDPGGPHVCPRNIVIWVCSANGSWCDIHLNYQGTFCCNRSSPDPPALTATHNSLEKVTRVYFKTTLHLALFMLMLFCLWSHNTWIIRRSSAVGWNQLGLFRRYMLIDLRW